jgi:hypothetical protein
MCQSGLKVLVQHQYPGLSRILVLRTTEYQRLHLTKREEWLALSSYFTPATIVRETKEHLGLSLRTCKGQAAMDRDDAAVIDVPANVTPPCDE